MQHVLHDTLGRYVMSYDDAAKVDGIQYISGTNLAIIRATPVLGGSYRMHLNS